MQQSQRREFKATEGLLHDVMRKQAGSVEKAVLEAVMNSVDAGASEITVNISETGLVVTDDGKGMTRADVEEYFEKFGLKDSDIEDKEFGKFRMGRGQIFNFGKNVWYSNENVMVVDLDHEETTVTVGDTEYSLNSEGLSYNLLDAETDTDGCRIEVEFYNTLEDVEQTTSEVRKLTKYIPWLHDVDLTVNGAEVYHDFDPDFESELAYYKIDRDAFGRSTSIYNKGAFVKDESITKTSSVIVTKQDMDVNFARTDILDTCDVWREVKPELIEVIREHLADADDLSMGEQRWLISQAADDRQFLEEIRHLPIIEDVGGTMWSIDQLIGEKVTFTSRDNKLAEKVQDRHNVIPIRKTYERELESIFESDNMLTFDELVEEKMWEMREFDEEELSKRRKERLGEVRWFLKMVGYDGDVKSGYSRQQKVWKDSKGVLYIDKDFLNQNKDDLYTEGLIQVLEIAAHEGSTQEETSHDHTFRRNFWRFTKNMGKWQKQLLNGVADA